MSLKVAVLMGGSSSERELSLASGKNVCAALEEAGHKAVPLDVTPELASVLRSERPDVCYSALHGKRGEDGSIQSLLEFVGVPFVGSRADVCRSAWNKGSLRTTMAAYRAITGEDPVASWPQGMCISGDAIKNMGADTALDLVENRVFGGYPVAVKPAHGCSAAGVHKVESQEALGEAILDALSYDDHVVIEQWIDGVELAVPVLGTSWDAFALPPVEIVPKHGLYDAEAHADASLVDCFVPVRYESLSPNEADAQAVRAEIERAVLEVHRAYGLRDLGRIDLIWDGAQARVMEVSVSPGMSEAAPFPSACAAAGLTFSKVMDQLVRSAVESA